MHGSHPNFRLFASATVAIVLLAGCHSKQAWWDPFELAYRPPPYPIETPEERMEKMRLLAERAADMPPDKRERAAAELQKQIQQESDALVRMEILKTLSAFPTDTSRQVLTAGLSDPDDDVRVACIEAWARRGGPEAIDKLSGVIASDASMDVRIAAARSLGEMHDVAGIPTLGLALADRDPALQFRAMRSIEKISGQDFDNDVRAAQQYVQAGAFEQKESLVRRFVPFY